MNEVSTHGRFCFRLQSLPVLGLAVFVLACSAAVAYKWSGPKALYGHVAFGPDGGVLLQFIARGPNIYLDRNGDNIPQWSECVGNTGFHAEPIELADPDSITRYVVSGGLMYRPEAVSDALPQQLMLNVDIHGPVQYSQYGGPILSDQPSAPSKAHFHGPLTIRLKMREELRLVAGNGTTDIRVEVSTYRPEVGGWAAVYSNQRGDRQVYAFASGVAPEIEVEFPAKVLGQPTIKKRFPLDQFC